MYDVEVSGRSPKKECLCLGSHVTKQGSWKLNYHGRFAEEGPNTGGGARSSKLSLPAGGLRFYECLPTLTSKESTASPLVEPDPQVL